MMGSSGDGVRGRGACQQSAGAQVPSEQAGARLGLNEGTEQLGDLEKTVPGAGWRSGAQGRGDQALGFQGSRGGCQAGAHARGEDSGGWLGAAGWPRRVAGVVRGRQVFLLAPRTASGPPSASPRLLGWSHRQLRLWCWG